MKGNNMINKDKAKFIERVAQMQEMKMIEESLKENPIFEDELGQLGYDLIQKNSEVIKDFKDRGLIIRRPFPTLQEFVRQAKGYVVLRSTLFQMEKEEFRSLRQSGLLNKGVEIYNDLPDNQVPVHFNWQYKEHNGSYTTSFTGGSNMVNVAREVLDVQESEARASEIRAVQSGYKSARAEIDFLLNNIEGIKAGTVNTQYHDSINRDHREL
jgi:hypothetical protein